MGVDLIKFTLYPIFSLKTLSCLDYVSSFYNIVYIEMIMLILFFWFLYILVKNFYFNGNNDKFIEEIFIIEILITIVVFFYFIIYQLLFFQNYDNLNNCFNLKVEFKLNMSYYKNFDIKIFFL